MIYLKDFYLPKDTWTDFYISPIDNPSFWPPDLPEDMPFSMAEMVRVKRRC